MVTGAEILLIVAIVIFAIGAWSRWWGNPQTPYWPAFICAGLFFWALSQLWPLVSK
jgi:hypothetical protein